MPDKFHIVVSFRTEGEDDIGSVSSDSASIEYEYARRNLIKAEEPQYLGRRTSVILTILILEPKI